MITVWCNNVPNYVPIHHFPNLESYVDTTFLEALRKEDDIRVEVRFEGNDDLMTLLLLKGQMDDMGFVNVSLYLPFFPYSTMDHTDNTRPLSLKYVANFINAMNFKKVIVLEPHSDALALAVNRIDIKDVSVDIANDAIKRIRPELKPVVCFPDQGAAKRYRKAFEGKFPIIVFDKKRNFADGKITGMQPLSDISFLSRENCSCVIVDDLCRAGRTFVGCGDALKESGAKEVILCVTHLEMGAFKGVLKPDTSVDTVYATNSCVPYCPRCEKLRIIPIDSIRI